MNIPFFSFEKMNHEIKTEITTAFEAFFDSGWYVLGERVRAFEEAYALYNKVNYAVGLSNGLDALHLALKALGVGPGDEVIVPSNTYIATVLAVSYTGATPVFTEPRPDTYNIDPARIEACITSKTRAIIPVHLYGQSCEMDTIMDIAARHNLFVVEDNAQSQGASFKGRLTGTWGDINATSFYPGKNLGALGDAGAVTTNRQEWAEKITILRNYGSRQKYYNETIGHNMRLDECQAAFLSVKLKYLTKWNQSRVEIAEWYRAGLQHAGNIILPGCHPEAGHVYHQFVIRTEDRDKLQQFLNGHGIGTLIHYPVPPHLQEAYASLGYRKGDFPVAEEIAGTCLSLPVWPGMTEGDVQNVCSKISLFYHG